MFLRVASSVALIALLHTPAIAESATQFQERYCAVRADVIKWALEKRFSGALVHETLRSIDAMDKSTFDKGLLRQTVLDMEKQDIKPWPTTKGEQNAFTGAFVNAYFMECIKPPAVNQNAR